MNQPPNQVNPERDAFDKLAFETLAELSKIHVELHPEQEMSHFLKIYQSLYTNPSVNGDAAISQLERAQDERKKGEYFNTALVVSSAYLAEANQEADREHIGRAWYALAKACYWRGVMRSVNEKFDFTVQAADAIRNAESGKGGKKRAAKFAEAKKLVVALAHESRPPEGWKTRSDAVSEIIIHLNDLASDNPTREAFSGLSTDRWPRTFSDWLGEQVTEHQFRYLFPSSDIPKGIRDKAVGQDDV